MPLRFDKNRSFSVELDSNNHIKNMSMTNGNRKEKMLIEGTIGELVKAVFIEGVVLEVIGTKGIMRVDLQAKELEVNNTEY